MRLLSPRNYIRYSHPQR